MSHGHAVAVGAVVAVAAGSALAGSLGLRRAGRARDFYVAARAVSPRWNAAAIGGEYLSAASYLGIAGLVLAYGYDMLWYPIGYTAGYVVLLAVVAAPMRRSGAYTLPDFAQIRLGSPLVRRVASALVLVVSWLYLVPQLQGAALTMRAQAGAPSWLGGLLVVLVVLVTVSAGGMRSITFAQAFQFWLKFLALLIPALVLIAVWQHRHDGLGSGFPTASAPTAVSVPGEATVRAPVAETLAIHGILDGQPVDGPVWLDAGPHRLGAGTTVVLRPGDAVPVLDALPAVRGADWLVPLGSGRPHPLYATLSLLVAICLGTMGLPHVLVRFYTNPDGRDARRTARTVIVLLSLFYLLPTVYGVLGRRYAPDLLLTGNTDAAALLLPQRMIAGWPGVLLGALVTAGAFAAFLSTASGLTVSVAGVLSQDVPRRLPAPRRTQRIRAFRYSAVVGIAVPYLLSLLASDREVNTVVGLAFAVAAAAFCPFLVLGCWWPGLTDIGALTGMLTGGVLATAAVVASLSGPALGGWPGVLLDNPAAWAVPVALLATVTASLATRRRIPAGVSRTMVRMHAPESPGLPG